MNKKFFVVFILTFALLSSGNLYAQNQALIKPIVYKVGIFSPLYLDSVFTKNSFKHKQNVPRFIMPAVDFVQGALIALDSLQAGENYFDVTVYDSKSFTEPVANLIQNKKLDSLQLIIGNVKDEEYIQLANFAREKNIPFISATYPNDGGVKANPFLVIINSTLKSHCEAIYSYILQNHGTDKIYLVRQKGEQEDMVASYFKKINEKEGKPLLNIETINLVNNSPAANLRSKLDSNSKNILIAGSLDEAFAGKIAKAGAELQKTYPITLIGMPTWDNFSGLHNKKELSNFPVYYTTAFYNDKQDAFSKSLKAGYLKKYKGKPSDMAFKGFESVYLFTKLLAKNPYNLMSNINDKSLKVFCEYNFRPVSLGNEPGTPDYFENKHLYIIKILNGNTSKAW